MTQLTLSEELNFSFVVNFALVMVFHKYPKNNLFEYIFVLKIFILYSPQTSGISIVIQINNSTGSYESILLMSVIFVMMALVHLEV